MKMGAKIELVPDNHRVKMQTQDLAIILNEVLPLTSGNEDKRKKVVVKQGLNPFTRQLLSGTAALQPVKVLVDF
jgi:hypothetical protein